MKFAAKLILCALTLAAVTVDGAENLRSGCEANDSTPAPTTSKPVPTTPDVTTPAPTTATPEVTTPAPTTGTPDQTTPAPTTPVPTTAMPAPTTAAPVPTTAAPVPTTTAPAPAPTTTAPAPTTTAPAPAPAPTTTAPAPTTTAPAPAPAPTTTAPAPTTTAPAPTTAAPGKFDPSLEYIRTNLDCKGFLRLPAQGNPISKTGCVEDYSVIFNPGNSKLDGCVVCTGAYSRMPGYMAICDGLPLCTKFSDFGDVTATDVMCMLDNNGKSDIATSCGFNDN